MNDRVMTLGFLVLLLSATLIPVAPAPSTGTAVLHQSITVIGSSSILISTQAIARTAQTVVATQTGAGPYAVTAAAVSLPFPLASAANVSGYTVALTGQAVGGLNPQGNGTQGASQLFNATLVSQLLLYPLDTGASIKTVALWTSSGGTPSVASYRVYYNATQIVQYSYTAVPVWNFNGTTYAIAYKLTPPSNVSFNQTQVFIPFPANVSVNYTSLSGEINGVRISPIQATSGGIYTYPLGVAAGATSMINLTFTPLPSTAGATPVLTFQNILAYPNGTYTSNASWFNGRASAYAGLYILQTRFQSPISPFGLQVRFGRTLLSNTSYTVTGGTITVLPLAYTTPSTSNITVYLRFTFAGNAPSFAIGQSFVVGYAGSVPITVLDVTLVILISFMGISIGGYAYWGEYRPRRSRSPENPEGVGLQIPHRAVIVGFAAMSFIMMVIIILLITRTT
jgi:hypothetical protein